MSRSNPAPSQPIHRQEQPPGRRRRPRVPSSVTWHADQYFPFVWDMMDWAAQQTREPPWYLAWNHLLIYMVGAYSIPERKLWVWPQAEYSMLLESGKQSAPRGEWFDISPGLLIQGRWVASRSNPGGRPTRSTPGDGDEDDEDDEEEELPPPPLPWGVPQGLDAPEAGSSNGPGTRQHTSGLASGSRAQRGARAWSIASESSAGSAIRLRGDVEMVRDLEQGM